MKRPIKFKLKNGKIVTIRRTRADDYDAMMKYLEKFTRDPGAENTFQYIGQPKKDKEKSIKMYESDDNLFVGVWDGKNMIGSGDIHKLRPTHPYSGRNAEIGISILEKYTHNGIGNKLLQILEKWAHENNVHKIQAQVRHNNIPSIANCIKNGFIITGIEYDAAYIKGRYLHHYSLEKIIEK